MIEVLLINSMIASERRREVQEERRRNGRAEPYVNYLAAPQLCRTGGAPLFARWLGQRRAPVDCIAALASR
jgi:hypothetical protein